MPSKQRRQALPFRERYVDTAVLIERLKSIYKDAEFELEVSRNRPPDHSYHVLTATKIVTDRVVLYAAKKLTKDQIKALQDDPTVYNHYGVPGENYHMGTSYQDT
ncbi:hypothetical protein OQA88_9077 [Cercophora sp. LCS_1]